MYYVCCLVDVSFLLLINVQNMKTPLIIASELNRVEMMRMLMDHGADINLQDIFGKGSHKLS